jgi:hypothetical protein
MILIALVSATLAACDGGTAPAPSAASSPSVGIALTPAEVGVGVTTEDIAASAYPPMDPRRYGANPDDNAPNGDATR